MALGKQTVLRPANSCVWYVLATIHGEPGQSPNPRETQQRNREFWNSLMSRRVGPTLSLLWPERRMEGLPRWGDEQERIAAELLPVRGFRRADVPDLNSTIDFSGVDFREETCFDGFVFAGPVAFDGARFGVGSHSFNGAIFDQQATFDRAEFVGEFSGSRMLFSSLASFKGVKFRSNALFGNSRFRTDPNFSNALFEQRAWFHGCTFGDAARFTDTEFRGVTDFDQVEIQNNCLFRGASFDGTVPRFFGATLPEYTDWHGAKWPKVATKADEALDQLQAYQRLARMMNGLEKFDDQRMFVRQEMRVRRRVDGWFPVGSMNLAYELICDYGHGLRRVAGWWLAHMLSGAIALSFSKFIRSSDQEPAWQAIRESFSEFGSAMLVSAGNAHGFLRLNDQFFGEATKVFKDLPGYNGIGAFQTIVGVIILFFLLLTIRNRFRMR